MDTLGNRFHVNFLGYLHWVISIRISQLKEHYISVDQARYATFVVAKYIDTVTMKENSKSYKTNLPHDMIFTKEMIIPVMNKWNYNHKIKYLMHSPWLSFLLRIDQT